VAGNEDEDLRRLMRLPAYRREGREGDRLRAEVQAGFAARYPGPVRYDATGRMETHVVAVRSYPRREPDGGVHMVRAHDRAARPAPRAGAPARPAAPQPPVVPAQPVERAWEGRANQAWREQVAAEESRDRPAFGYSAINEGTGALGRYQLTPQALVAGGWLSRTGEWTEHARAHGVTDRASFLARPRAQERALDDYLSDNERLLRNLRVLDRVGQPITGMYGQPLTLSLSGLAAAAHREGAPRVREYLQHIAAGLPPPPSVEGRRGKLSSFREIERRLQAFAGQDYRALRGP